MNLSLIPIVFVGGLLGSIPFGVLVTRAFGGTDPRRTGSGNIGATNVLRAGGWTQGLLTLAGDILKGAAAVLAARLLMGAPAGAAAGAVGGVAAVLGHMYSPFTGFRGGKGVATGLGVFAVMMPVPTAWAAFLFAVAVALTRYVSAGSILGAAAVPLAAFFLGRPAPQTAAAALIAALIIWRHKENIGRLLRGEENRFGRDRRDRAGGALR